MAVLDRPLDPSIGTLNARIEALIDTAVEQWHDFAGIPVPSQVSSRSPISQARMSMTQDSHDSKGIDAVKREEGIVLKHEAACNIRTPQVEAQGESMFAIPESNGQSLTGNTETAEQGRLSAEPTLERSTTPLTAERKALPLCSTFSPVSPYGPITIYSSGEGEARNVNKENSDLSSRAESSLAKRKADQSVVREDHSLSRYYQCDTQSRYIHKGEEVETDEIEVQPAESNEKRRKIEHMQGLDSDEPSDHANLPHIPFLENFTLPADIKRISTLQDFLGVF